MLELLDGVDLLHRRAVHDLAAAVDPARLEAVRASSPAVAWVLEAYAVGVDERAEAQAALATVLPTIRSQGGDAEVVAVDRGVVQVRMSGACTGCSASATDLQGMVEDALREGYPGFVALEAEPGQAGAEPSEPALLQLGRPPGWT